MLADVKTSLMRLSTGRFLYALGNVHASLENYDESLEYHQRALNHYRNTLGSGHHRTADTLIRIVGHFIRLYQVEEALWVQIILLLQRNTDKECQRAGGQGYFSL
jgi:tetratricopeptide (TPR) repeat protein